MSVHLTDPRVQAIVNDPMHELTAGERTLLRKLGAHGPALSIGFGKGWMLGGTRYSAKTLQRFLDLKLARFWRDQGGVKLGLNDMGALAAYRITPRQWADPAVVDDDEPEHLDRPPED